MNRFVRIGSASLGMVLLAGLALYQGKVDHSPGERDIMSGTALAGANEARDADCKSAAQQNDMTTVNCKPAKHAPDKN